MIGRLMGSRGLSVKELGATTRAEARSIQRDLNKLRECGLPLESFGTSEPRYRLENLRVAGAKLDLDETLAITLALSQAGPNELGTLARRAWDKLHYAVVNGQERRSKADLPAMLSARSGWQMPAGLLRSLSHGLLESLRLRILYQGLSDSAARWRLIDPWQLFFQDHWYLLGWDPATRSTKTFRTERIQECQLTEETFIRPNHQTAADAHFHRWDLADTPPIAVTCRVDEAVSRWLLENPVHPTQRLDGMTFTVEVRDVESFLRWTCSLSCCQVLEPLSVRQAHRIRLLQLLAQAEEGNP